MGRKKITIQQITDPKLRNITYNKRKNGLIKKAAEISLLCNINLMLVFEDLNGNLVQFSRSQIKNISNFTNECRYKRVLELTAEDYPDFSKIKRHKKKQCIPEQSSSQAQSVSGKVRTFTDMYSDQDSIIAKEEVFNDFENIGNAFSSMDIFNGLSDLTNYGDNRLNALSTSWFQPDILTKKVKPNTQNQTIPQQSSSPTNSQKENRNKLGLRLKISNNEENAVKEAVNSQGSRKKGSSQKKAGSSQKNSYSRRSNFDPNVNQRKPKTFYDFMNEECLGGDFSEFSPFSSQIFRPSPNMKYREGGEMMTNENIMNCLTNSGRNSLNQQRNMSSFQQYMENSYDHGYGMEAEIGSTKKQNYMEQLSARDSYSRVETAAPTESVSGRRYVFNGFFNSDQMFMGAGETKLM